ncbi:MAG: hypothetical protein ACFE0R_03665 [Salinarimonas sp.]
MLPMLTRPRHPDKEIEAAVAYAEARGWRFRPQGHWGRLYCPHRQRDGCRVGVFGTPRDPGSHARDIKRTVDRCPHEDES